MLIIEDSGVETDHYMVTVQLVDKDLPYIGPGRWTLPIWLLEDKTFKKQLRALCKTLEYDIRRAINDGRRVQTLFKTFKKELTKLAHTRLEETATPKVEKYLRKLEVQLRQTLADDNLDFDEKCISGAIIQEQIHKIKITELLKKQQTDAAAFHLKGETISKYWSYLNKEKKPRDII